MNETLKKKFIQYRNYIFYNANAFQEVINNGFETQTFSRTYLTKFKYKYSQKNLSDVQIKNKLIDTLSQKYFLDYITLDNNLILTNNKYPYVSTNNNAMFIIWDVNGKTTIDDIQKIINKYFIDYNYLVWRNPCTYQSIKLIKHYHVVFKSHTIKPVLKKVVLVVRHGPREPIYLPKNFESGYWSLDKSKNLVDKSIKAKITCLGKIYCQFCGQEAYDYYSNEINFNKLSKEQILIESSHIERTVQSALYYMNSFRFNFNNEDIIISDCLASDKLFNLLELASYQKYIQNFDLDINTDKLNKLTEMVIGQKINNSIDYFHIYSTIKCYKVHEYKLPCDIDNLYDLIEQTATLAYNEANEPKNNIYSRVIGEQMLKHIFDILRSNKILSYLSTHDNMIIALLKYMCERYNLNIKLFDIPNFCSCVRFELWNNKLRIYYDSLFLIEIEESQCL